MTTTPLHVLPPAVQRRIIARGLARALASTVLVLTAYFVAPFHLLANVPVALSLAVGSTALLVVTVWQVRQITRDPHPGLRAVEALAVTAPLFLILFSAGYVVLSQGDPASFSVPVLTRTDALYFTITTFATVGFGDITPTSQAARRIVTGQMVLDLLILGLGIRVLVGAVQRGRRQEGHDVEPREPR